MTERLVLAIADGVRAAVEAQPPPSPLYCLALMYTTDESPVDALVMLGDVAYRERELALAARDGVRPLLFAAASFDEDVHPADVERRIEPELVAFAEELGERWELTDDYTSAEALFEQVARRLNAVPPKVPRTDDYVAVPVDALSQECASFDRVVGSALADHYRRNGWHPGDL